MRNLFDLVRLTVAILFFVGGLSLALFLIGFAFLRTEEEVVRGILTGLALAMGIGGVMAADVIMPHPND